MGRLINIGYGNLINSEKIVSIMTVDSAPSKRLIQTAKEDGRIIDGTQGRRTRAAIIMDSGHVVLSALLPDTISGRYSQPFIENTCKESEDE